MGLFKKLLKPGTILGTNPDPLNLFGSKEKLDPLHWVHQAFNGGGGGGGQQPFTGDLMRGAPANPRPVPEITNRMQNPGPYNQLAELMGRGVGVSPGDYRSGRIEDMYARSFRPPQQEMTWQQGRPPMPAQFDPEMLRRLIGTRYGMGPYL